MNSHEPSWTTETFFGVQITKATLATGPRLSITFDTLRPEYKHKLIVFDATNSRMLGLFDSLENAKDFALTCFGSTIL